jgi:hypothetical protein
MPLTTASNEKADDMKVNSNDNDPVFAVVEKILFAALLLGMIGSGLELVLLKHTEEIRQWIPLVLLGAALPAIVWHYWRGDRVSTRLLRWLMVAFIAGGAVGIYFHFQGAAEFKLEGNPSLRGWALFWEAIRAKAPPLLAPGAMIQLGLIGLAYLYKFSRRAQQQGESYAAKK